VKCGDLLHIYCSPHGLLKVEEILQSSLLNHSLPRLEYSRGVSLAAISDTLPLCSFHITVFITIASILDGFIVFVLLGDTIYNNMKEFLVFDIFIVFFMFCLTVSLK